MRCPRWWQAGIAIPLFILLWSARAQDSPPATIAAQSVVTAYKGSGSCSAVTCHGSIAPLSGSSVLRNEHTTWIADDPHSRAFQVLFDERSRRIARNLARGKEPIAAAEDARCLACHTTPRPESLVRTTGRMNSDGVGCESCHGSAEKWLGIHTTDDWKRISPTDKQERYGFTDMKHLVRRVELCAGCHIGRDARDSLPVRDVNHDLIAAGHPRLNFEFAAYQENQPKHWKPKGAEATTDFPARAWVLGQLVSAKAALELLRYRCGDIQTASESRLPPPLPSHSSTKPPWPEFAEYGCFSCHHSLADEPWRRNRGTAGVPPGAPVWGSWYYPMTAALLENSTVRDRGKVKEFQTALKLLTTAMSRPNPHAAAVRPMAERGIAALDGLIQEFSIRPASSIPFNAAGVEQLIDGFNRREAWNTVANWDHAAQRYLALVPLNQARGRLDSVGFKEQQALSAELRTLFDKLRFPEGYDSPRGIDPATLPAGR
jgi:hypothetical protein